MKYIITVIVALLLTACVNSITKPKVKQVKAVETKLPDSLAFTEYNRFENNLSSHSYDIEGRYKLERGLYMNGSLAQGKITNAYMIVEKLDENDFGYYFADKLEGKETMSTFGVFHYDEDDKKFHQKIIDGDSFVIRKGAIELITDGNRIKLTIQQSVGRKVIIWQKESKNAIGLIDDTIDAAIKDAEDSYNQVYAKRREELIDDSSIFNLNLNIFK
jgi:hypothetical protein